MKGLARGCSGGRRGWGEIRRTGGRGRDARGFEVDFGGILHGEQIDNTLPGARDLVILIDTEENMGGMAAVGNEHRTFYGGFFGPIDILIELSTRDTGNAHRNPPHSWNDCG